MISEKVFHKNNDEYSIFFGLILVLVLHLAVYGLNKENLANGISLTDGDGYWHLLRVEKLYETKNLNDMTIDRSNSPYGENLHWSIAFDILIFIGAYIGSYFIEFKKALFLWSLVINPIFHIFNYLVMIYVLKKFLDVTHCFVFGCFFAFQQHLSFRYFGGIPDHHGVLLFFFSVIFCLTINIILFGVSKKISILYGVAAAIGMWNGVETLVILCLSLISLGIIWVYKNKDISYNSVIIMASLLVTVILTIFIDSPSNELFRIEYDRRSIVHLTLFILIACFWFFILVLEKYSSILLNSKNRLTASLIAGTVCITIMYFLFPNFFSGPISQIDPLVKSLYLDNVGEFRPIYLEKRPFLNSVTVSWIISFFGFPLSIYIAYKSDRQTRYAWCYIAFINASYLFLAIKTARWISYCQLVSAIPLSYLGMVCIKWINANIKTNQKLILKPLIIITFCFGFWLIPYFTSTNEKIYSLLNDKKFLHELCTYLNEDPNFKNKSKRILTSIYLGPLLLYNTGHEVVGTPAHRNKDGIIDTYRVMNARNEKEALDIIEKRGIDVLIIGLPKNGIADYFKEKDIIENDILHAKLWGGNIPEWLEALRIPETLSEKIKVFRVFRHS